MGYPPPKTFDKLVASDQAFFRGVPGAPVNPDPAIRTGVLATRSAVFHQAPALASPAPGPGSRPQGPLHRPDGWQWARADVHGPLAGSPASALAPGDRCRPGARTHQPGARRCARAPHPLSRCSNAPKARNETRTQLSRVAQWTHRPTAQRRGSR
ncbi:hypothetical protein SMALA_6072 [Streptomyces malaysiensis subsp. malaysiensis]|nr:hypothetical protein SMALA_6072 [Streptomyces malaysiensis]